MSIIVNYLIENDIYAWKKSCFLYLAKSWSVRDLWDISISFCIAVVSASNDGKSCIGLI